jgi:hypothetical protein
MPKKKKIKEIPTDSKQITIFGIFCIRTSTLIKVDLIEDNIWFEYDTHMYDESEYSVIKLEVSY